jgi:eukaryotic-like serine/threonine-protein kinase
VKPAIGTLVGDKYQLLERLDRGGMGEVFRARNVQSGEACAVKILRRKRGDSPGAEAKFVREAQAIARIGHPGVVEVRATGVAETGPYLVMEYLRGEPLSHALRRHHKLERDCAVAIVLQVLDALEAAHRANVVHRDIKPANVFLQRLEDEPPRVKLLDFGIAKLLDASGPTAAEVLGTPDYVSPEQAWGSLELDGRSDLFSVGSVLFELVTGAPPFRGPTGVAVHYRITHSAVPLLVEQGGPDDLQLQRILERGLAKSPAERFQSAAGFARALEGLAGLPADPRELRLPPTSSPPAASAPDPDRR